MSIEQWWTKLQSSTRAYLIANNGDVVPAEVVAEIARAGGPDSAASWWADQNGTSGHYFPDDAIDWVEAIANDEKTV
jgi:hypothetical protein